MSVLKRHRNPSPHQFVVTWQDIGKDTSTIVKELSKRKGKFILIKFIEEVNAISLNLTRIDEMMMKSAKTKNRDNYIALIQDTYEKIRSFTQTLFVICFITKAKFKSKLEDDINKEFMLLEKILESMDVKMKEKERVKIYDRNKIAGAKYLEKLEELSDFTYSKTTNLKGSYNIMFKIPLQSHVADAFRMCYEANQIKMDSVKNIDDRKELLNTALEYLSEYEKLLWNLFSFSGLSNQAMEVWSNMYVEAIKMIKGIIAYCNRERNKLLD